jgi:cystathionine gamma-synthase
MADLLSEPLWQAESLGQPIPPSPYAVSVSLPLWQHVIGYEESDPQVVDRMQAGYPRFFLPLVIQKLFRHAEGKFAAPGEGCFVFPSRAAVQRCRDFVQHRHPEATLRLSALPQMGVWAIIFPEEIRPTVKLYWRFSGEVVSARWAESGLERRLDQAAKGTAAKEIIRKRIARHAQVSAQDVFLFPSGMGAVFAVWRMLQAVLPNRPSVQLDFPYVDVLKVQENFGKGVYFYPEANEQALSEIAGLASSQQISSVFCEVPSNPLLRCVPLARLRAALEPHQIPLVVDDTIGSVINVDALKFADVVTTSLTKSFSGTGDVIAGAVTLNPRSAHYTAFQNFLTKELAENDLVWWEDAVVLEENSRDFPKRARRAAHQAQQLAEFLKSHPAVEDVFYPSASTEGLAEILRPQAAPGCLFSFTLKNPTKAPAVYDALRVCKGPSLGTNFTLVCPYTLLAHYTELEWAAECGVAANLLRVSVGLEELDDLKARFSEALAQAVEIES